GGARRERALVPGARRQKRHDLDELRARREAGRLMLDDAPAAVAVAVADSSAERGRALLLARSGGRLPALQAAEGRGAALLLAQPGRAPFSSVAGLAERGSTRGAPVVAGAQKLGFRGFHDLKVARAEELAGGASLAVPEGARAPRLAALAEVTAAGA